MIREFSAGGVVVRRGEGRPFVAVVRVRDQILALPKGHPDGDESPAEAAGARCARRPGSRPSSSRSSATSSTGTPATASGCMKIVAFFLFRYRSGSVEDHDHEVEEALWIPLEEAPERLAYKGEREMAVAALSRVAEGR